MIWAILGCEHPINEIKKLKYLPCPAFGVDSWVHGMGTPVVGIALVQAWCTSPGSALSTVEVEGPASTLHCTQVGVHSGLPRWVT